MYVAFINLLIVAFLGLIMRYKIAYYLPFIDQNNFLEGHSHFAFAGWVTQALMALLWAFLLKYLPEVPLPKYKWLLIANLVTSYSVLVSFVLTGYGIVSIIFTTFSILVSWVFIVIFWKDINKIKIRTISIYWFKAALIFNFCSSFGVFFISYMIIKSIQQPNWLLATTYYYLHFQYNGWFFFACMGLFIDQISSNVSLSFQKKIFWLFTLAFFPAYFLSALWLPIPQWVYVLVVVAATADLLGWILILKNTISKKSLLFKNQSTLTRWLFILPATALSIKFLLQLGSTIPFLSTLAFGFRPVVIGYLHLMFLGVITLFIIGYCKWNQMIIPGKNGNRGIILFVTGIILNEILLMIQGLSYMNYINVPYINELLFVAAIFMLAGVLLFIAGIKDITSIKSPL